MFTRRTFVASSALLGAALFVLPAAAAGGKSFSMKDFKAAQAAGKSIFVEVHADWCPVCTRQKPITAALRKKPAYKDVVFFTIDYDKQKDALRALRVNKQSTMISFKGKTEKGRSVGVTDPAKLEALLKSSI